jgi:hydroxyacylglutathione hydrolase
LKWVTTNGCEVYQTSEGRSNSYLIFDKGVSFLVDTSIKKSRKTLMGKLNKFLGEKELSYLILTHAHYDHFENVNIIKEKYRPKIVIQSSEGEILRQGNSLIPKGTNILTRIIAGVGRKLNRLSSYEKIFPDILVDDYYFLSPNCYLIHTPGHTKGSMSLIVDGEIALVGDAMFGVFSWSIFPPFADDVPTMIQSWEKLLKTGCKVFLPGHGTSNSRKILKKQLERHGLN